MRRRVFACLAILILAVVCYAAEQGGAKGTDAGKFLGTWTGAWDGAGTGGFELTLEKGKEDATGGKVSVTGEPTYTATLKTVAFEGPKMTAAYDFPPDDSVEVLLEAAFDGSAAKGTWVARGKNGGSEVATGTWTVKRK